MSSPGWSAVQKVHKLVHWESTDIIDSQLPTWISLKAQIREGKGALWWPYGTGGQPVSLELFNPTFLVFLTVKDNAIAYYLVGLVKLVVAGFGGYFLLRIFLRWLPSVWGGMVFMLCGFNAAWFYWDQVATAMWIPWLLGATVRYLKTENAKWLPAITLASLLLILGGFPAVAGFGFYSFGLLLLFWNIHDLYGANWREGIKNKWYLKLFFKKTALPLLAVCIAFLMSSVTLVPFIDFMSGVNLGYRAGAGTHFSIRDLPLFFSYENPSEIERTAYIGILVIVFALVGFFSAFRTQDEKLRRFIYFNILLAAITILITFGILPHSFIRSIPIFNTNDWGRLIVVPLLGLAVLSSIGVDYCLANLPAFFGRYVKIPPSNVHGIIVLLMVLMALVQFHFQKKLFNSFNAVVPSSWFFPFTPSIKYVKGNLKPLQSVIADKSFNMSGTLGAYGIAQWYAHAFRTDKEKKILGRLVYDPFPSPTSAQIDGGNILFDSSLMDKLVIKYLLVHKDVVEEKTVLEVPAISQTPAPPLPGNSWNQHIHISNDMRIGYIGFLFSTYPEARSPANVRLILSLDDGGNVLAKSDLDRDEIAENKWAYFRFPQSVFIKKGDYSLALSLVDYAGPGKLTVWATKIDDTSRNHLDINGNKSDVSLKWRIVEFKERDPAMYSKRWNRIDLEPDILILENKQVTNSAYFVKALNASNKQIDFSGLTIKQSSSDVIEIDYSGGDAGWIVLPMHLHPGWKAYLQDREIPYGAYLDILPAIPVQGASKIVFRYEPASFKIGAILSFTGIIIFSIFSILSNKNGARRKTT